jgi:hypothetical protein
LQKEQGIKLSFKEVGELVKQFKEKHRPILNRIGQWAKMQFLDSQIAERIFTNLVKQKIPVLGIHDSFIVQKEHENILYDEMINCYKKETGFQPVIH